MAKQGKLSKLLKKMQSFNKRSRTNAPNSCPPSRTQSSCSSTAESGCSSAGDFRPVYVGKSRRRYMIGSEVIEHPLFKQLAERSSSRSEEDGISVGCEVVMFEHMLWMLENADLAPEQSVQELVEFYAY